MGIPDVEEVFDDISSYLDFLVGSGSLGTDCSKENLALIKNWGRRRPEQDKPKGYSPQGKPASNIQQKSPVTATPPQMPVEGFGTGSNAQSNVPNSSGAITEDVKTSVPEPLKVESKTVVPTLEILGREMDNCRRCGLRQEGSNVISGWGSSDARVVFVTGVPDSAASHTGNPFAGESGALLDRMVKAMRLPMESVYYTSIVRCFPGGNTGLLKEAFSACMPYFWKQMGIIKPEVIVSFGTFASCAVTGQKAAVTSFRGKIIDVGGTPVMPTHHPSELIRDPSLKRPAWDDLKHVMGLLGIKV